MTSCEFMYMNKNLFTVVSILFRAFVKSALLQSVCRLVMRCVLPALFTHKYQGQIMGGLCTSHLYPPPPRGWGLAGLLTAPLKALHSGAKLVVKSLLKAPALPGTDNNKEQQMT